MSHDAALHAGLEHFPQRNKAMDSFSKWSPSERVSFTKDLGLMQLAKVRMHLYFKFSVSFPLLSKKNKGDRLGNHEKNVTKSYVDRRDFVAAACSLHPQIHFIQRNLNTAKPFSWQYPSPSLLSGSIQLQFYVDKMSGLHLSPF